MNSDRFAISWKSRNERLWLEMEPLFMPMYRQLGPPAVDGVVPVFAHGNGFAGGGAELARAVVAAANAVARQAAPTVVGETFRVAAFDDFGEDAGDVLVVVGAVDAGNELVGGVVRIARRIAREPIRMAADEFLGGAIAVHAGQHRESILVRRFGKLAIEIAPVEELGLAMEREPAGIVGDDAAGVDDQDRKST